MPDVSAPCENCGKAIRFGFRYCDECGNPVSRSLILALEERLDATSSEFRNMRTRLWEAGILLFVLGVLRIILSIFFFLNAHDAINPAAISDLKRFLAIDLLTGMAMACAAPFIEKRPEKIVLSVIGVWVSAQILVALISPAVFIAGFVGKIIFAIGLTRSLTAARRAEALRSQLIESASRY